MFSRTVLIPITRKWMRFAIVITGVILATAVVSFIAGYKSLVEHASVNYELGIESEASKRLEATMASSRIRYKEVIETDQKVEAIIRRHVAEEGLSVRRYRRSATFYLESDMPGVNAEEDRAFLVSLPDSVSAMELIQGQNIRDAAGAVSSAEIQIFLDSHLASLRGIHVGDKLNLIPYWEDTSERVIVRVAGTVKLPYDAGAVWQDKLGEAALGNKGYKSIPLFVSDETLFQILPEHLPRTTFDRSWRLELNSTYAVPGTLLSMASVFDDVRLDLLNNFVGIRVESEVAALLGGIEKKLFLAGVPIVLIGVQVGVVAFIYVMAIGVLFWERQEREFQLLIKRGARGWALFSVPLSQVCFCVLAATLLGPLISLIGLMGLHLTAIFDIVPLRQIVDFGIGIQNFVLSFLVACIGAMAMVMGICARVVFRNINVRKNIRGGAEAPIIFRYNLDIGLLVIIIPVMWELLGRRSLVSLSEQGDPQIAPLAYALPIGISIVVGLMFVRILPVLFSVAARIAGNSRNTVLYLGALSMSRGFSALRMGFLLLGASVSVLIFSLSLGEAISGNMEERALYDAGADIRIGIGRVTNAENSFDVAGHIKKGISATQVSPVYRGSISDISSYLGETYTMLAIEPMSHLKVAQHRDDVFHGKVGEALGYLGDGEPYGTPIVLPTDTLGLGITVTPDKARSTMSLMARLSDGFGVVSNHRFGLLDFTVAKEMEIDLSASLGSMERGPYTILSLYVHDESTRWRGSGPGALYLDNLQAFGRGKSSVVVLSTFEDPHVWGVTTYPLEGREVDFDLGGSAEDKENRYGVLSWQNASFFEIAGISPVSTSAPLKALVSESVIRSTAKSTGEIFVGSVMGQTIPIEIVGVVPYFPTVDIDSQGLVLVNIAEFMGRWQIAAPDVHFLANEFWASLPEDRGNTVIDSWVREDGPVRIVSVVQSGQLLEASRLDPVVLGGWGIWVVLASFASFAFTAVGIATLLAMQVDKLRNTFFVLKALGLSSFKSYVAMVVDLTLMCCVAVVVGVVLGNLLQLIVVPMINVDVDGARILPPVVTAIDWARSVYVCLGVIGLLVPLMIVSQMWLTLFQQAQTLRLEEL